MIALEESVDEQLPVGRYVMRAALVEVELAKSEGIEIRLWIEGQRVALPDADAVLEPEDVSPQVLLYSSGDLNLFQLELRRENGGAGVRFTPALAASDRVEVTALEAERR